MLHVYMDCLIPMIGTILVCLMIEDEGQLQRTFLAIVPSVQYEGDNLSALSPAFDVDNARLAARTNYAPNNIFVALIHFLMFSIRSGSCEVYRQ
jgi:uncharacterized membrane protein